MHTLSKNVSFTSLAPTQPPLAGSNSPLQINKRKIIDGQVSMATCSGKCFLLLQSASHIDIGVYLGAFFMSGQLGKIKKNKTQGMMAFY